MIPRRHFLGVSAACALGTPEAFGAFMAAQSAKWDGVAKKANIKVE